MDTMQGKKTHTCLFSPSSSIHGCQKKRLPPRVFLSILVLSRGLRYSLSRAAVRCPNGIDNNFLLMGFPSPSGRGVASSWKVIPLESNPRAFSNSLSKGAPKRVVLCHQPRTCKNHLLPDQTVKALVLPCLRTLCCEYKRKQGKTRLLAAKCDTLEPWLLAVRNSSLMQMILYVTPYLIIHQKVK